MSDKKWKLKFAPGAFDDFNGSQEELDELITAIQSSIDDGSIFRDSIPVDFDDVSDDLVQKIEKSMDAIEDKEYRKKLN